METNNPSPDPPGPAHRKHPDTPPGARLRSLFGGATNAEIARRLGVHDSTIHTIVVTGDITQRMLDKITALTGCDPDWLRHGTTSADRKTLAQLLELISAQVATNLFAVTPSGTFQDALSRLPHFRDARAPDLSHARAAAAAVGLSVTADRKNSTLIFRRLLYAESADDYVRISGLVECGACGRTASDHPPVAGAPFLTAMCDGRAVKL